MWDLATYDTLSASNKTRVHTGAIRHFYQSIDIYHRIMNGQEAITERTYSQRAHTGAGERCISVVQPPAAGRAFTSPSYSPREEDQEAVLGSKKG